MFGVFPRPAYFDCISDSGSPHGAGISVFDGAGRALKVGDVVFATDRHRVRMIDAGIDGEQTHSATCFLEPRVQLVVQKIGFPPEGLMIAKSLAIETAESPSCSAGKPVVVHTHQVTLKADLWGGLRDTPSYFFSRR